MAITDGSAARGRLKRDHHPSTPPSDSGAGCTSVTEATSKVTSGVLPSGVFDHARRQVDPEDVDFSFVQVAGYPSRSAAGVEHRPEVTYLLGERVEHSPQPWTRVADQPDVGIGHRVVRRAHGFQVGRGLDAHASRP